MTFQPTNSLGVFLPTTIQYPKETEELIIRLNKAYEDTATRLNAKQVGVFDQMEFVTGEQWPVPNNNQQKRQPFRKIFFFNDGSLNFAHNITGITLCTHIYGTGTDGTNFFPIPYVDVTNVNNQIMIVVTPTNVVITKGGGAPPAITNGVIVLEYLKN